MKPRTLPTIVEHAASGFLLPEATARRIDALSRGLPRDFGYRRRSAPAAELELDPGERTDVSTITTDALDRDRECVLPAGGDWSAYNRVVPFAHDYRQLPAGSCWWIKPKSAAAGSRLIAKTHYPAKPADWGDAPWLPSAVLHLLQQPVPTCTGKSIGFLPLNIREATGEEIARRPELKGVPVIDRWAGIEYSVVPVPCNPEAEMLAVAKGVEAGVFDSGVAELITKAMTPFLDGWRSPLRYRAADPVGSALRTVTPNAGPALQREIIVLDTSPSDAKAAESGAGGALLAPADSPTASANVLAEPMPPCPQCGSNDGVARRAQDSSAPPEESPGYTCEYCGSTFDAPTQPPVDAKLKGTAGIHLHHAGYARAEALIAQGKLTDAPWSFTAEDHRSAHPDDSLAVDDLAGVDTEAHWKYPVIKRGEVYRRGVAAAESRASQEGQTEIADAARRLMQAIHAADAAAAKAAEIDRAASAAFVRPETIRTAIRRAVEDARGELPSLIRAELTEAFARATGKV